MSIAFLNFFCSPFSFRGMIKKTAYYLKNRHKANPEAARQELLSDLHRELSESQNLEEYEDYDKLLDEDLCLQAISIAKTYPFRNGQEVEDLANILFDVQGYETEEQCHQMRDAISSQLFEFEENGPESRTASVKQMADCLLCGRTVYPGERYTFAAPHEFKNEETGEMGWVCDTCAFKHKIYDEKADIRDGPIQGSKKKAINWKLTINLGDVWAAFNEMDEDDTVGFQHAKAAIVARLKAKQVEVLQKLGQDANYEFRDIIDAIETTVDNIDEFNSVWEEMYNFADQNEIWIDTMSGNIHTSRKVEAQAIESLRNAVIEELEIIWDEEIPNSGGAVGSLEQWIHDSPTTDKELEFHPSGEFTLERAIEEINSGKYDEEIASQKQYWRLTLPVEETEVAEEEEEEQERKKMQEVPGLSLVTDKHLTKKLEHEDNKPVEISEKDVERIEKFFLSEGKEYPEDAIREHLQELENEREQHEDDLFGEGREAKKNVAATAVKVLGGFKHA